VKRRFAARPRTEVNGHADGGGTGAAPLVESHAPVTPMAEPPDVNGHHDGDGNGTAPPAESHSPRVPAVDDVLEPPVEAL
jgi:hypothetical protein